MKYVPIVITALALSACQAADSSENTSPSAGATVDVSHYPDFTATADRSKVDEHWIKTVSRDPQYPMHAALAGISGCVEMIYSINASGRPEGYRIVDVFPVDVFEDNALAALARWRWKPSPTNTGNQPVLTATQLDFVVSNAKNSAAASEKCDIEPI